MSYNDRGMEIGRLQPFRALLETVQGRETADRERRPVDDPALLALAQIRRELAAAIAEAQSPDISPTIAERAALEGVTTSALYKREERARKRMAEGRAARSYVTHGRRAA